MAKKRSTYVCQSCGAVSPKWVGKCPECETWSSMVEEAPEPEAKKGSIAGRDVEPQILGSIKGVEVDRTPTGIGELDQVLGGGLVLGSVVLVGGEPGIGKSTIMLQVAGILGNTGKNTLYVSGEESPSQIKLRADRLGVHTENVSILSTNSLEDIIAALTKQRYDYLVTDSIQTVASEELTSAPGTVGQVKHVTYRMVEIAKQKGITTFIVGQVTKEGYIAGPKVLEHLVDTVLYFEGDYSRGIRILRSVKNRFGPTNEVGLFEMSDKGLMELNESGLLAGAENAAAGKVFVTLMEGTRAFLVELQALVTPTFFQFSRRNAMGFDANRLNMLLAVLDKKAGLNLGASDVYMNVAGGMKISETAADLAICAAVVSSFRDNAVSTDTVFIGEVGLTGEIRNVSNMKSRLAEASKFGIKRAFLPEKVDFDGKIDIIPVKNVTEFIDKF
ncbi:DNA repair protein RadA [Limisalsivibrio acetivorans]|uniref:DNA repair protein RadA n=1 Tax=Limisalsivibrio acetivorans TaxID=1304888 RepID=UPI0003B6B67B|nr:DNA repair protein RadA [Limisalsivibrio acetivorans]